MAGLRLRNRIIMAPMGSLIWQTRMAIVASIQTYCEARAEGGAGMLIVGVAAIAWPEGACNPNQVAISTDEFLPGLSALAARIKQPGCLAAIQLQHAGKVDIQADTVILASGARGDLTLAQLCEASGYETWVAGDCNGVAYIEGAIRSAREVARGL